MDFSEKPDIAHNTVCVVGAGALGLVTIKNLREQGLRVTAFERNSYIGGIWHPSPDPETLSSLLGTKANVSKEICSFTDFPIPEDFSSFPRALELQNYLTSYANNFDLVSSIQFSTLVVSIERNAEDTAWVIHTRDRGSGHEDHRIFDKVVVASGMLNSKNRPRVEGLEKFAGTVLHSSEFKDPQQFKGKAALVVGVGSSGADTARFLVEAEASKVYLSHRSPFCVLPRFLGKKPFDHYMTRRVHSMLRRIGSFSPLTANKLLGKAFGICQSLTVPWLKSKIAYSSSWGPVQRLPFLSDELPKYTKDGRIDLVPSVAKITGPDSLLLDGGQEIRGLDAIIFCTGYTFDTSAVRGAGNPTDPAFASDEFSRLHQARFYNPGTAYPRLYRGYISEQYPDSLAFLGHLYILMPVFSLYDLASMALASVWSGAYALPTPQEIRDDIESHYKFVTSSLERDTIWSSGFRMNSWETYKWMNQAAGTGVIERLESYGWSSWKFWLKNPRVYYRLMDGVDLPAVYRLFHSAYGRRTWGEALVYIKKTK